MAGAPIDLILLRGGLVPDLPVRAGDVLPARVISRDGAHGLLYLAGTRVPAQLPAELTPGTRMRLRVQESAGDKVVLRVVPDGEQAQAAQQAPPAATADPLAGALRAGLVVTLPGGAVARLFVDPEEEQGGRRRSGGPTRVTLRFEAAALGRVDLALELSPGAVAGTVHAPAGGVAERLAESAPELRAALAAATGRPASVTIRQRGETVDLHA